MTIRRVALAGFLHETNTFAASPADLTAFVQGGGYMPMVRGQAMVAAAQGVNLGIAGALAHGAAAGWQMRPLLWTGAIPSAPVTQAAYDQITGEILALLTAELATGPLDGVFLDLHGAMVAAHLDDGEGWLLAAVRRLIGPGVPLVAALDLHGNITRQMVDAADMLVGFRTYPHVDMAETGRRAAVALDRLMGGARAGKAFRQLDYLIPISWQATAMQPARGLYELVAGLEGGEVLSTSFFPGFPAADFADCGPSVLAYATTVAAAERAADRIAAAVAAAEPEFAGIALSPDDAVREAAALAAATGRPVVIADTQDNPGAGGDSNTTGMLRALVAADAQDAAIGLMVDPAAAAAACAAGAGAVLDLTFPGSGLPGDPPFAATFVVEAVSDGRFRARGPYYGDAPLDLGPAAALRIGGVRVVVASRKAQLADREMFRFIGIVPEDQAILVVKSSVHFRADFEPVAAAVLVAAAPGPMPVSPAALPWQRLRPGIRTAPMGQPFVPERRA